MGVSTSREQIRVNVATLLRKNVAPDDSKFWDGFWKISSSGEDVLELFSPEKARVLRDEQFDNITALFNQATMQLDQIVDTPFEAYFDQALNCVRVLTRLLSIMSEKDKFGNSDVNIELLFWGTGGNVIPGNNDNSEKTSNHDRYADDPDGDQHEKPLGLLVMHAVMHMLFLPQLTCDFYEEEGVDEDKKLGEKEEVSLTSEDAAKKKRQEERDAKKDREMRAEAGLSSSKTVDRGIDIIPKPKNILWTPGLAVEPDQLGNEGSLRKYDKNRIEVLRLLLVACCDPLFSPADEFNSSSSRWLAVAVAADAPNAVCLFYSLLNTVLYYDPSGLGLIEISAQVLCVLLDCGKAGSPDPVYNDAGEPIVEFDEASMGGFNIFRTLLARIDSRRQLNFCFRGFARLLKDVYENQNTYLAGSPRSLDCFQEILILLWKMLEENPMFTVHILTQCDINEFVVPICYLIFQARNDPAQIGLVHICTFILLKLSGERGFGVKLNKPFNTRLPCDLPPFSGSHADLLSITLHTLIMEGTTYLPLYSSFITIICNISPYWRSMSLVAANNLVDLFVLFSSPQYLYSGDNVHRHLGRLLEIFSNVIQYQYKNNEHVYYAIVRRKDSFGFIVNLTLSEAIAQCRNLHDDDTNSQFDSESQYSRSRTIATVNVNKDGHRLGRDDESVDASAYGHDDESVDVSYASYGVATVGGFVPTKEWLSELKGTFPLDTIGRLLQHIVPLVDELTLQKKGDEVEEEILEVLRRVTVVGLLPVPHAIVIRKYHPNHHTARWFTAFMWGVIFLRNQALPIFDGHGIELFQVSVK